MATKNSDLLEEIIDNNSNNYIIDSDVIATDPYKLIKNGFESENKKQTIIIPPSTWKDINWKIKSEKVNPLALVALKEFRDQIYQAHKNPDASSLKLDENHKFVYHRKEGNSKFVILDDERSPLDKNHSNRQEELYHLTKFLSENNSSTELVTFDQELIIRSEQHDLKADIWREVSLNKRLPKGYDYFRLHVEDFESLKQKSKIEIDNFKEYLLQFKDLNSEFNFDSLDNLFPNHYFIFTPSYITDEADRSMNKDPVNWKENKQNYLLMRYDYNQKAVRKASYQLNLNKTQSLDGINPRNIYQEMLADLLTDPEISMVLANGSAGTGKSVLGFAAASVQLTDNKKIFDYRRYRQLIVVPNLDMVESNKDIGFLTGNLEEKLKPRTRQIEQALNTVYKDKMQILNKRLNIGKKELSGGIRIMPSLYARGINEPYTFLILDEAQNMSYHEFITLASRLNDSNLYKNNCAKAVIMGDLKQGDSFRSRIGPSLYANALATPYLKAYSSKMLNNPDMRKKIGTLFLPPDSTMRGNFSYLINYIEEC